MSNISRMIELSKEKFGELSEANEILILKVASGEIADFTIDLKEINHSKAADKWSKGRVLDAGIITWLCTDSEVSELVAHKGIRVKGARIDGKLDLMFARISFGLFFENCVFSEDICLKSSRICTLNLSGSNLCSIDASNSIVENGIFLSDGFQANGIVCLDGVILGGSLDCTGGLFINPGKWALEANGAKVPGSVFLNNGFRAEGMVGLVGMEIGGNLECNQGEFINKDKVALNANGLRVGGDVFLCEGFWGKGQEVQAKGFRAKGEVKLVGAEIKGSLECRGGDFVNPNGPAFQGKGIRVDGSILLHDGFRAEGSVNLVGAKVGGNLECNCGRFINRSKTALDAERISVKGNVFLSANSWGNNKIEKDVYFYSEGEIKFIRAEIGGSLECTGGHFFNETRCAFNAMNSEICGNIYMRNGFKSKGLVSLVGATINGNLECNQGLFINNKGTCLDAERVKVFGDVFLCDGFWGNEKKIIAEGFRAEGEVKFVRAVVTGSINCRSGMFVNPGDSALKADGLRAEGNVFLCDGFKASGQVHLGDAIIVGNLKCTNGEFANSSQIAINAERLKVKGDVFLDTENSGEDAKSSSSECFKAEGEVKLVDAVINGSLKCTGAIFSANKANSASGVLNLLGATINKQFVWTEIVSPKKVKLELQTAKIGEYLDDKKSWPAKGLLNVAGMTYNRITDIDRREWLGLQRDFQHQPYEQLASVLRKNGRDNEARKVLIAKARERAKNSNMSIFEKAYHDLLGLTIGYGYLPWRAFRISVVIVLLGALLFGLGNKKGLIKPTKVMEYVTVSGKAEGESGKSAKASEDKTSEAKASGNYPTFGALMYSLDVFVPLVNLHQAEYWLPNANSGNNLHNSESCKIFPSTTGSLLRLYMWFHIILGWLLTTLLFVGLSGFIKR